MMWLQVNGDTVFMNSNFKKFNAENHETRSWNEQNAMTNTAVCFLSLLNISFVFVFTKKIVSLNCFM